MNTAPIRPAAIDRDADGTPRSREHGDIYHPRGRFLIVRRYFLKHHRRIRCRCS